MECSVVISARSQKSPLSTCHVGESYENDSVRYGHRHGEFCKPWQRDAPRIGLHQPFGLISFWRINVQVLHGTQGSSKVIRLESRLGLGLWLPAACGVGGLERLAPARLSGRVGPVPAHHPRARALSPEKPEPSMPLTPVQDWSRTPFTPSSFVFPTFFPKKFFFYLATLFGSSFFAGMRKHANLPPPRNRPHMYFAPSQFSFGRMKPHQRFPPFDLVTALNALVSRLKSQTWNVVN